MRPRFALASGLISAFAAVAASAQPTTSAQTAQVPAPKASVGVSQVQATASAAIDTDQIATPRAQAVAPPQLTGARTGVDAPAGGAAPGQSRDTSTTRIAGHDRCADEAAKTKPECAHILDQHADSFDNGQTAPPPAVNTTDAQSLVDNVVNGGTGTVVTLPPPK